MSKNKARIVSMFITITVVIVIIKITDIFFNIETIKKQNFDTLFIIATTVSVIDIIFAYVVFKKILIKRK